MGMRKSRLSLMTACQTFRTPITLQVIVLQLNIHKAIFRIFWYRNTCSTLRQCNYWLTIWQILWPSTSEHVMSAPQQKMHAHPCSTPLSDRLSRSTPVRTCFIV